MKIFKVENKEAENVWRFNSTFWKPSTEDTISHKGCLIDKEWADFNVRGKIKYKKTQTKPTEAFIEFAKDFFENS